MPSVDVVGDATVERRDHGQVGQARSTCESWTAWRNPRFELYAEYLHLQHKSIPDSLVSDRPVPGS